MTSDRSDEREPAEPADEAQTDAAEAVDWPDRSHWSEFDLAIEGAIERANEAEPPSADSLEVDQSSEANA